MAFAKSIIKSLRNSVVVLVATDSLPIAASVVVEIPFDTNNTLLPYREVMHRN